MIYFIKDYFCNAQKGGIIPPFPLIEIFQCFYKLQKTADKLNSQYYQLK